MQLWSILTSAEARHRDKVGYLQVPSPGHGEYLSIHHMIVESTYVVSLKVRNQ